MTPGAAARRRVTRHWRTASSKARDLEQGVRELERLLSRKTTEVEVLREALAVARKKVCLAVAVAATSASRRKWRLTRSASLGPISSSSFLEAPYRAVATNGVAMTNCWVSSASSPMCRVVARIIPVGPILRGDLQESSVLGELFVK
jgi:hypothetical protein